MGASAEILSCHLRLNLIQDASSSEYKQMSFEVDVQAGEAGPVQGKLVTTSCFNRFEESATAEASRMVMDGASGRYRGSLEIGHLLVGEHSYRLDLVLIQKEQSAQNKEVSFTAAGKMLSFDDEAFIHQRPEGVCYLMGI